MERLPISRICSERSATSSRSCLISDSSVERSFSMDEVSCAMSSSFLDDLAPGVAIAISFLPIAVERAGSLLVPLSRARTKKQADRLARIGQRLYQATMVLVI